MDALLASASRSLLAAAAVAALTLAGVGLGACSLDWSYADADASADGATDAPVDATSDDAGGGADADADARITVTRGCGPAGLPCDAGLYCLYGDGRCGDAASGACVARPTDCTSVPTSYVCACNGRTYPAACRAAIAGEDTSLDISGCNAPAGTYACGHGYCNLRQQYCLESADGAAGCVSYTSCTTYDCNCPEYRDSGCTCQGSAPRVTITCP